MAYNCLCYRNLHRVNSIAARCGLTARRRHIFKGREFLWGQRLPNRHVPALGRALIADDVHIHRKYVVQLLVPLLPKLPKVIEDTRFHTDVSLASFFLAKRDRV